MEESGVPKMPIDGHIPSRPDKFMASIRNLLPFAAILCAMALGLRVDVMDVDAAQYASISAEIVRTGNWLSPTNDHGPYLDKPPLHFWLSALSMTVFGMGNIGYKFPALIMALLALYATYTFAWQPAGLVTMHYIDFMVIVLGSSVLAALAFNRLALGGSAEFTGLAAFRGDGA